MLERALRLLDRLESSGSADDGAMRRVLELRVASLAMDFGDYERAEAGFHHVERDSRASASESVRAIYGQAELARTRGEHELAIRRFIEGSVLARRHHFDHALARGLVGRANVELQRSQYPRAVEVLTEAKALVEALGDPALAAEVVWLMGELARGRGDVERAERMFRDALGRFTRFDDRRGMAHAHAKLAVTSRMRDDLNDAAQHYRVALDHYRSLGLRREVAHQLNGLGDVARFRKDGSLASENYRRAVDIFHTMGLASDAALALTNLGLVALENKQFAEAEESFRRALKIARKIDNPYLTIGIELNFALLLAQAGQTEESQMRLHDGLARAQRAQLVDPDYARPIEALADVHRDVGDVDAARALYRYALDMWTELSRGADQQRVEAQLKALDGT